MEGAGQVCPVCGGDRMNRLQAAVGERAYCLDCFHGWRTEPVPFAYSQMAMCPLGTAPERLQTQIRFFASHAKDNARILEIGCATGELAAAVRNSLRPSRYDAIELSPAREAARARVDRLYEQPLGRLLDSGEALGPYDLVLMSHVLEHIEDPRAELGLIARVMAPGALLFLETPNGPGHRGLPIDDNASHLHFFTASSLTRLLASCGFETIAAATDVRLDARYADSLQVLSRAFSIPDCRSDLLSDHPLLVGEDKIVVWGAGSLAQELLANFFDISKIDFFVDRDPSKCGGVCLGRPIKAPGEISGRRTILANSIDFGPAIAADISRLYPDAEHRIVQIGQLLDRMPRRATAT